MMSKSKSVVLGMSGGVDSSVSAALLKEEGYDVTAVFMKNWSEEDDDGVCTAAEDYLDVVRVCEELGINHYTVNFEEEYKERVFSYFLSEYEKGRTPNPDVMCNTEIKFKAFLDFAMKLDADYIAMGHYARTLKKDNHTYLLRGVDENKDQSYFLSRVNEEALSKTLFPIGNFKKEEVRKIAEKYNLSTAKKKDSTGICFIGERDFNKFLDSFLFTKKGDIYSVDGEYLGEHSGLIHYTIGQRKGIGIGGVGSGEPFFVADKDLEKNRLIVAQGLGNPALYKSETICEEPFWITKTPTFPLRCTGKIRYRAKDEPMVVDVLNDELIVKFDNPIKGVTPGQILVFYDGDICLGSGIIK
nr:tRNA 2-thiouridine(34) synthase MnmA [Anaerosphaera multitolerans]